MDIVAAPTRVLAIALIALGGCRPAQQTPIARPTENAAAKPSEKRDARQIALAAKDELFKRLSTRLLEAMGNGGPATAISVCRQDAPQIAKEVGRELDVAIGRTSFKLRNPGNVPPDWVKPFVMNRPTEALFVDLPDNHTGAVFPIFLKVQCLACHGPRDQISADVQAQLAKLYPADQAVDFQEGDLRGWFWVDVPDRTADKVNSHE